MRGRSPQAGSPPVAVAGPCYDVSWDSPGWNWRRDMDDQLARYHRQMLLPDLGEEGQRKLLGATALIAGCGGLGTAAAGMLARAGVGNLKIVDRDFIEMTNLQRQVLYDERDVAESVPKAEAARRRIAAVNSQIEVTAIVDDINHANVESLVAGCDVVVDGLDSFETRYLVNDAAVKLGVPYVYGGAVACSGSVYAILPHTPSGSAPWEAAGVATPCLRCIFEQMPPPAAAPTCDTVGVLGSVVSIVGNYEAVEALKILTGAWAAINPAMVNIDVWENSFDELNVASAYDAGDCPCCRQRRFEFIEGKFGTSTTTLCGGNSVQLTQMFKDVDKPDLDQLAERLKRHGPVSRNPFMLRAEITDGGRTYELSLFADGRAIVKGTTESSVARSVFAKYVGT